MCNIQFKQKLAIQSLSFTDFQTTYQADPFIPYPEIFRLRSRPQQTQASRIVKHTTASGIVSSNQCTTVLMDIYGSESKNFKFLICYLSHLGFKVKAILYPNIDQLISTLVFIYHHIKAIKEKVYSSNTDCLNIRRVIDK